MPAESRLRIVRIEEVRKEAKGITTLRFRDTVRALPGQFIMVWIPLVDEIPMSLSWVGERKGITVRSVGEATEALANMEVGGKLGIRGPYGTHFSIEGKRVLIVGGGTGIAPLAPLVEKNKEAEITSILGAKTAGELFMVERFEAGGEVYISTDDGSAGFKGTAFSLAVKIMKKERFDQIIACGPEPMLKSIAEMGRKEQIPVQISIERFMKCGIGLCDSCAIGRYLVCRDGPVFAGEELLKTPDFGCFRRDAAGRKVHTQ